MKEPLHPLDRLELRDLGKALVRAALIGVPAFLLAGLSGLAVGLAAAMLLGACDSLEARLWREKRTDRRAWV